MSTGLFKHYRGGMYSRLWGNALAAGDIKEGDIVTVYVSLQDGGVYVRADSEFHERVRSGIAVGPPRFQYLPWDEAKREVEARNKKLGIKPRRKKREAEGDEEPAQPRRGRAGDPRRPHRRGGRGAHRGPAQGKRRARGG